MVKLVFEFLFIFSEGPKNVLKPIVLPILGNSQTLGFWGPITFGATCRLPVFSLKNHSILFMHDH